jgi:hypothetical protein
LKERSLPVIINHAVHLLLKHFIVGSTAETYITQHDGNGKEALVALSTAHAEAHSQHTVISELRERLNAQ